jgi:hypothetical protein
VAFLLRAIHATRDGRMTISGDRPGADLPRARGHAEFAARSNPRGRYMKAIAVVAAVAAGLFCGQAAAQTKVGDWEIEKRKQDDHCNATRAYKDSDGNQNVVLFSYSADKIVIVLVNEGWEWPNKDDVIKADFSTEKATIMKESKWQVMDKDSLRGLFEFDASIFDKVSKAKTISLEFGKDDDNDTDFEVPQVGEALAALKYCEENKK